MIFRISQSLNVKIKGSGLAAMPLDENPFADWSAHLFVASRTQYVILSNTKSLYSTVMPAKGIASGSQFVERAFDHIQQFMRDDGQEFVYRRFIEPGSEQVRFAKAWNRSVTGSMNDLIRHAAFWLADGKTSITHVGFDLNDILLSSLGRDKGMPYGKPRVAFKEMADGINPSALSNLSIGVES